MPSTPITPSRAVPACRARASSASSVDPPAILVSGRLGRSGTRTFGELFSLYQISAPTDLAPSGPGGYSIELRDAAGKLLGRYGFKSPWTDDVSTRNVRFFSYRVPNLAGTAQVRLVRPSCLPSRWTYSAYAPSIRITSPANGSTVSLVHGRIHVACAASDADHNRLSFSIAYSNDGGQSWMTEALQTINTSIDIPVARGAHDHLVRVYATDGGRSSVATVHLTTR